jgi:hypothetical protein
VKDAAAAATAADEAAINAAPTPEVRMRAAIRAFIVSLTTGRIGQSAEMTSQTVTMQALLESPEVGELSQAADGWQAAQGGN